MVAINQKTGAVKTAKYRLCITCNCTYPYLFTFCLCGSSESHKYHKRLCRSMEVLSFLCWKSPWALPVASKFPPGIAYSPFQTYLSTSPHRLSKHESCILRRMLPVHGQRSLGYGFSILRIRVQYSLFSSISKRSFSIKPIWNRNNYTKNINASVDIHKILTCNWKRALDKKQKEK